MSLAKKQNSDNYDILTTHQRVFVDNLCKELLDPEFTEIIRMDADGHDAKRDMVDGKSGRELLVKMCHRRTENTIIFDYNGNVVVVYRPDYFSQRSAESTSNSIQAFQHTITLHTPTPNADGLHKRYGYIDHAFLTRRYSAGNFGVLHLAAWMEQGRGRTVDPMVSREMVGVGASHFMDCVDFLQYIQSARDKLSFLYAAAAPSQWRNNVDIVRKLRKYRPGCQVLSNNHIEPWSCCAVTVNLPSEPHTDVKNAYLSLDGLIISGDYGEDDWFVVPSLHQKFRLHPQAAILFDAKRVTHFIETSQPSRQKIGRSTINFFNHGEVFNWVLAKHAEHRMMGVTD